MPRGTAIEGYEYREHAPRDVEIRYEGRSYPATVRDEPLFDPDNERMIR